MYASVHPQQISLKSKFGLSQFQTKFGTTIKLIDFEQSSLVGENNDASPLYVPRCWDGINNINIDLYGLGACLFRIYDNESFLPIGTSMSPEAEFYINPVDIEFKSTIPSNMVVLIKQYLSHQY